MKKIIFFANLILTGTVFSQKNVEEVNSIDIIREGIELHDKENYTDAIEKYSKVSVNDTNYSLAQFEIALSHFSMKEYKNAQKVLTDLLSLNLLYKYNNDIYGLLGSAYDEDGQLQKSVDTYTEGLKKFPMCYKLWYNRAYTYEKMEKFNEAIQDYQQALICKPNHQQSHYRLGMIAFNEEKYTKGALCLMTALVVNPNSDLANHILVTLENISNGAQELKSHGFTWNDSEDFDQLDELFKNKVALESSYKVKLTIKAAYGKQIHFLLSNLKYDKNNLGFWNRTYLPLLMDIYAANKVDDMVLYTLQSSGSESVQSKLRSKKSKITAFVTYAGGKWAEHVTLKYTELGGVDQFVFAAYEDGAMVRKGKLENQIPVGKWYYYYPSGALSMIGEFSSTGEKTGLWEIYNELNGKIESKINFKNDKLNGDAFFYYIQGDLKEKKFFKDGSLNDTLYIYYRSGDLLEKYVLKDGVKEGPVLGYYENGKLNYSYSFKGGKADGPYKSYYTDGQLFKEFTLKDDLYEGAFVTYHANGKKASAANYKAGKLEGLFESWYPNGQLNEKLNFTEGKQVGEHVEYYTNGNLSLKGEMDESGKQNGTYTTYDLDGKKYIEQTYKKGDLIEVACFDKKGTELFKSSKKGKNLDYKIYYPDGILKTEGKYENGNRSGKWSFYDEYGTLSAIESYKDGLMEDTAFYYHRNGKIKNKQAYKNGEENGLYLAYNAFGILVAEGLCVDGQRDKDWYWYNEDGSLKDENYYINGEMHGLQKSYSVNGKLNDWEEYEYGRLISRNFLDTNGNVLESYGEFHGDVSLHDVLNKYVRFKATYKNGSVDGTATWYGPTGAIETTGKFTNNERIGTWKYYHENGKLAKDLNYLYGELEGVQKDYNEEGILINTVTFVNGLKNGIEVSCYDSGKKEADINYLDDERHDKAVYYDENGAIYMIRYYKQGVFKSYSYLTKEGKEHEPILLTNGENKIVTYFQNGQKSCEHTRINGWLEGHYILYNNKGQVLSDETFKNGEYEGLSVYYYANGVKKREANYHYGLLDGIDTEYYENGKIKSTTIYVSGSKHGVCNEYSKEGKLITTKLYYNDELIKIEKPK